MRRGRGRQGEGEGGNEKLGGEGKGVRRGEGNGGDPVCILKFSLEQPVV